MVGVIVKVSGLHNIYAYGLLGDKVGYLGKIIIFQTNLFEIPKIRKRTFVEHYIQIGVGPNWSISCFNMGRPDL